MAHAGSRSAVAERIPSSRGKEERTSFRVRVEVWEVEAKSLAAKLDAKDVWLIAMETQGAEKLGIKQPATFTGLDELVL